MLANFFNHRSVFSSLHLSLKFLHTSALSESIFLRNLVGSSSFACTQTTTLNQNKPIRPHPFLLPISTTTAHATMTSWDGGGTQEDFMLKDECIIVDENDQIVGHGSKYDAHRFTSDQPSGILHRAFSVFLFDSQNRLLLQQRAACKITFPRVWTNTCCSHPLYGYTPTEVDSPTDVESGQVPGVKRAAIRKLLHELGIRNDAIPIDDFKFLTRLHYCARDGSQGEWGEHEIDYILFVRATVDVDPNPEEVMDIKYVTHEELKAMMDPNSGLLWSPWFRIIAENFLETWWKEVDAILDSDRNRRNNNNTNHNSVHMDITTIHKI